MYTYSNSAFSPVLSDMHMTGAGSVDAQPSPVPSLTQHQLKAQLQRFGRVWPTWCDAKQEHGSQQCISRPGASLRRIS